MVGRGEQFIDERVLDVSILKIINKLSNILLYLLCYSSATFRIFSQQSAAAMLD